VSTVALCGAEQLRGTRIQERNCGGSFATILPSEDAALASGAEIGAS
jgi:hypothetical protein